MPKIFPFAALTYDPRKVGGLDKVVTQPYDKISDEMRERYYAASPFNLTHIIRGKTLPTDNDAENVYTRAARYLSEWRASGILHASERPALFAYFQDYEIPGLPGVRKVRKGFIGLGKIEDYSAGVVFPHEQTLSTPKEDRLRLLRATRTHFGQIFMLYSDPEAIVDSLLDPVAADDALIQVTDEYGAVHTVWRIEDPDLVTEIQRQMADKKLIIADGHHRYETALTFRNECRQAGRQRPEETPGYEKVMMTFVNMESSGLTILPAHRLMVNFPNFEMKSFIQRAQELFNLAGFKFFTPDEKRDKLEEFRQELREVGQVIPTIGLRVAGTSNFYLMKLKSTLNLQELLPGFSERQQKLDVVILHKLILERCLGISEEDVRAERYLRYVREFEAGLEAVDKNEAQMCFFLNPTRIEQVRDIALAGERLPQKSTDFYPKLLSGLTLYSLDPIG